MSAAAGPPQGANSSPTGGSAAAQPQAWGDHHAAGPSQGANSSPTGGSAAAQPQAWGDHTSVSWPSQDPMDSPAKTAASVGVP